MSRKITNRFLLGVNAGDAAQEEAENEEGQAAEDPGEEVAGRLLRATGLTTEAWRHFLSFPVWVWKELWKEV